MIFTKNKKAQADMMGMAIVIILIIIALVFVIKFSILDEPENYKQDFTASDAIANVTNFVGDLKSLVNQLS